MIEYVVGDLFDYPVIGHGVNCVGAMGSGIALPFKNKFPNMHYSYVQLCRSEMLRPGQIQAWTENGVFGYNIASQYYPGPDAREPWLAAGLNAAVQHALWAGHAELSIPRIGAGIGGLSYEAVQEIVGRVEISDSFTLRVVSLPGA